MNSRLRLIILVSVGVFVAILLILILMWIFGPHYKPLIDTKTDGITSFAGAENNNLYYVQNSRLYKKDLVKNRTDLFSNQTANTASLSPDQKKLFYSYNSAATESFSGRVTGLGGEIQANIDGAGNVFWSDPVLFYSYVPSMLAGSVTDASGKVIIPTYPYSYISNFDKDKFVFTYGEGSEYDTTLKVYSLPDSKIVQEVAMRGFAAGPVFFGNYIGYTNQRKQLIIYNSKFEAKTLNLPVSVDSLTQQFGPTQYFILTTTKDKQQIGVIYQLNLDNGAAQELGQTDLTPISKLPNSSIKQVYYDQTTDSLFVGTSNKLYTIKKIHSK